MPRLALAALLVIATVAWAQPPATVSGPIDVEPKPVASDKAVKLDYDIVYVRMPRKGDGVGTNWTEISNPVFMDPGADLILLRPDGSEEVLVKGGADWEKWDKAITDTINKAQDKDGGWSGHHCITGRTFCTSGALLVLMADRAPVPVAAKMTGKK